MSKTDDEIKREEALRVHDRSHRIREAIDEAVIKAGEVAIKTVMLVNGGAAVSVLAFIGALVRQDGVTVKQVAGVSGSLLWFAGGVAVAILALALSYFANFCYVRKEASKTFIFEHPYIIDGANTRWWHNMAYASHLGAIVWSFISWAAFVVGAVVVRDAIIKLAS